MLNLSSKLIEKATAEFSKLPGIGSRTALRLTLHLLKQSEEDVKRFSDALMEMKRGIMFCSRCMNISDSERCAICENKGRDQAVICVVEDFPDIIAIENTNQYNGLYHVLGGIISPVEGIGPADLNIDSLVRRVAEEPVKEILLALSSTMEGDTTSFYISKKMKDKDIKLTAIARGIPVGDELEYTDELTLGRSIRNRIPYDAYQNR